MEKEKKAKESDLIETRLVHGKDFTHAWDFSNHLIPPMTGSTTYRLKSIERGAEGFVRFGDPKDGETIWIYDRLDEPNNLMLEEQLSYLEQSESSVSFASGMGAISAICLSSLKSGDLLITDNTIYGCTYSLFENHMPRFNIEVQQKDFSNLDFLDSVPENLRLIYFESVANPTLKITDIQKLCAKVKELNKNRTEENKILVAIDNTFATPLACNPISFGADFSVNSLTKNIAGFGTELGGMVSCSKESALKLKMIRKDFGAVLNSKSSWNILNHGLPTLQLRYEKQQESAQKVVEFLQTREEVEKIYYPTLQNQDHIKPVLSSNRDKKFKPGFMVAFTLKGEHQVTKNFINKIAEESYSITLAVSLGLTKTLIEVPRLMTHSSFDDGASQASDISDKLIRLSIGVENVEDIINDLRAAF